MEQRKNRSTQFRSPSLSTLWQLLIDVYCFFLQVILVIAQVSSASLVSRLACIDPHDSNVMTDASKRESALFQASPKSSLTSSSDASAAIFSSSERPAGNERRGPSGGLGGCVGSLIDLWRTMAAFWLRAQCDACWRETFVLNHRILLSKQRRAHVGVVWKSGQKGCM